MSEIRYFFVNLVALMIAILLLTGGIYTILDTFGYKLTIKQFFWLYVGLLELAYGILILINLMRGG